MHGAARQVGKTVLRMEAHSARPRALALEKAAQVRLQRWPHFAPADSPVPP